MPLAAASVSVELPPPVTETGLNDGVTPEGYPLAESATLSADPLMTAVEIVDVALPPWTADALFGFALIEKSFGTGAVTVRATVVLWVALRAVPVTVTEYVPVAVALPTLNVRVELEPAMIGFGLKDAVVPAGTPVAESVTLSAEPPIAAVAMVDGTLPPWAADTLLGLAPIEKSEGVPQPGSWNVPILVRQLNSPLAGMYSFVYQNVQPSTGSMVIAL